MTAAMVMAAGLALDFLLGDPRWLPHPVVGMGKLVAASERVLRRLFPATTSGEKKAGVALVVIVAGTSFSLTAAAVYCAWRMEPWLAVAVQAFVCCQSLAARCLADAAKRVESCLVAGDLDAARAAVSHIVGRDTASLDAGGVARAAVETVAENSSDGVVAPMLYFAVGGAPLAMLYKAINTMDSMVGYKNERYRNFGWAAARVDDIANFVPARLTAVLLIVSAAVCGLDWRGAIRIFLRDRRNHSSPNSAQPESACAGALGVRLGGDSIYGGTVVRKPSIGDAVRDIEPRDIGRAARMLFAVAVLSLAVCGAIAVLLFHVLETPLWI